MFREGWITLNSVPTHVMTFGGWIEDDISSDSVLVFIPGNPGITDFYYFFLETLFSIIGIPTWVINHAGTEPLPENFVQPSMDKHPELYNLAGQIDHQRQFIEKYIPKDKKIILIGHSVGGKMCVELMKDKILAARVLQAHLVFPTLQHIAESLNGKVYKNFIQYIIPVIVSLSWVFVLLPLVIRRAILSSFIQLRWDWNKCHRETCLEGILKLFTPQVTKAALCLARDEIYKIKNLDSEIYEKYHDKIFCYYAPNDNWAPVFQYHHLMETHPKINGVIVDKKFTHAFVLTAPADMAEELGKNIGPCLKANTS